MFSQPGGLALLCFLLGLQGSPAAGAAGMLGCWRRVDGGFPINPVRRAAGCWQPSLPNLAFLPVYRDTLVHGSICWLQWDLLSFQKANSAQVFAGIGGMTVVAGTDFGRIIFQRFWGNLRCFPGHLWRCSTDTPPFLFDSLGHSKAHLRFISPPELLPTWLLPSVLPSALLVSPHTPCLPRGSLTQGGPHLGLHGLSWPHPCP